MVCFLVAVGSCCPIAFPSLIAPVQRHRVEEIQRSIPSEARRATSFCRSNADVTCKQERRHAL